MMTPKYRLFLIVLLTTSVVPVHALPPLPEERANNPFVRVQSESGVIWFTGMGIAAGKTHQDLRADGWFLNEARGATWQRVPSLPAFQELAGRLGSHAIVLNDQIMIIGGYTVAADHTERSIPGIYQLNLAPEPGWQRVATMPVPVDDAVAFNHRDQSLVLISGWSDTGNVNLVQVWNARSDQWRQAEPWPGAPVFGHSGGLLGDRFLVCGGAKIIYPPEGPRQFLASDECWLGALRDHGLLRIDWQPVPAMPGGPRYRAGAIGLHAFGSDRIVFAGGADRPYNYNGVGYDGKPAQPFDQVVSFDIDERRWYCHGRMPQARMDHRSLVHVDGRLILIGGMDASHEVLNDALIWTLETPDACSPGP